MTDVLRSGCWRERLARFALPAVSGSFPRTWSVTISILFFLMVAPHNLSAQSYTSDPNIADFTNLVATYATLSNYSAVEGGCPAGSFTPTSDELATTGCRIYSGGQLAGLSADNNWLLATFPTPVSQIIVFPNIDHYGDAYDGYQYIIYGSNDGQNWTFLFDASSVGNNTEPFTLGSFTGTPPTTVNNVLTPQSQPLPPGCSGTPGVLCAVGYIAQFTFGASYQYYAFGASSLAFQQSNPDQELSAVGTPNQTVTQPFNTTGPATTTFNNGEGTLVQQTIDASDAGSLTCHGPDGTVVDCSGVQLSTTNMLVSNTLGLPNSFPPWVRGGPFSSAICAGRPGNGPDNPCSIYTNACWGGNSGVGQGAASDFYCPFVDTTANPNGFFVLKDTWDPMDPKPPIAPGTTVSLIDFVPTAPDETWAGSPLAQNPVCTQVAPGPATAAYCHITDTANQIYNDQTTTRGTQPKKGWLVSLFNVQMLLSTVQVFGGPDCPSPRSPLNNANPSDPGFEQPSFAQNIWNNSNCLLGFQVNPAQPPSPDTNNFVAAPPLSLFYGSGTPPITPGGAPEGSTTITNPNAVCVGVGLACNAQPWLSNVNDRKTLSSVFGATDGTFILYHAAKDFAGVLEKNAGLDTTVGDFCPNPENPAAPIPAPCYFTNYFTTIVNLDSTNPQIAPLIFSPAGGTYSVGQVATASFSCSDPPANGAASSSGVASCQASVDGGAATSTSPVTLNTMTAGMHAVTVTATDNAGNTATRIFNYTVLADADVAIYEQHTSDSVKPGGTLTYLAWALDLSKTSAAEVTVTEQIQLPPAGVQLGNVTARVALVSCTTSGCSAMPPAGGANCNVSGTTITCNIGTLPSIYGLKGALIKTSIPVLATSKVGTAFRITATVNSPNDPNPKNNNTSDFLTICSPN